MQGEVLIIRLRLRKFRTSLGTSLLPFTTSKDKSSHAPLFLYSNMIRFQYVIHLNHEGAAESGTCNSSLDGCRLL